MYTCSERKKYALQIEKFRFPYTFWCYVLLRFALKTLHTASITHFASIGFSLLRRVRFIFRERERRVKSFINAHTIYTRVHSCIQNTISPLLRAKLTEYLLVWNNRNNVFTAQLADERNVVVYGWGHFFTVHSKMW